MYGISKSFNVPACDDIRIITRPFVNEPLDQVDLITALDILNIISGVIEVTTTENNKLITHLVCDGC